MTWVMSVRLVGVLEGWVSLACIFTCVPVKIALRAGGVSNCEVLPACDRVSGYWIPLECKPLQLTQDPSFRVPKPGSHEELTSFGTSFSLQVF